MIMYCSISVFCFGILSLLISSSSMAQKRPRDETALFDDGGEYGYLPGSPFTTIYDHRQLADTAKCYSCMSKFYEAVWPALSTIYKRPKNFTDKCDDVTGGDGYGLSLVDCPTICVRMWEDSNVAGVRIRGHIRGCLDDVVHSGFNRTVMAWYRWMHRDSCRSYRKRELLQLSAQISDDSFVNVCTCYSDFCNSAVISTCRLWSSSIVMILCMLLLSWRRLLLI